MSQRSFLFGSVAGDRVYDPAAFARAFRRLIGTGVVEGDGNELAVTQDAPAAMNVLVDLGSAFVLGYYFEVYGAAEVVAIPAAHATLPRIDRVVVQRDLASRTMALVVKQGVAAASPAAPALTQNEAGVYEISLARVAVAAAAVSIVNANITDERTYGQAELGTILDPAVGHDHDGADSKKVTYADLLAIPATFAPAVHAHDAAGTGGVLDYTDLGNVPAIFAPSAHEASHRSGGGDALSHANLSNLAVGDPHTQYQQESEKNVQNGYAGLDNDASARVAGLRLGTGYDGSATKVLLGDRTWGLVPAHASRHATGGADPITPANIGAPSSYNTPATATSRRIYVGTSNPTGMSEGDVWING